MSTPEFHPLTDLDGLNIVRWVGHEMALSGGDHGGRSAPVLWEHESVPFWQSTSLDAQLADGRAFRLLSQCDDGTDFYGLYLKTATALDVPEDAQLGSIFRTRKLPELPTGVCHVDIMHVDAPASIVEARLAFAGGEVRLLSAEVHERANGQLDMVMGDGAILVQVNSPRPSALLDSGIG